MTTHLSDDDLVLLAYGEEDHAAAGARAHVASCPRCADVLRAVRDDLDRLEPPATPERGEDYGVRTWERLQPRLDIPVRPTPVVRFRPRSWAPIGGFLAIAASLVFAFWLGQRFPEAQAPALPEVRERILLVAVGDHLERTQMVLVELMNAPAGAPLDVRVQQASATELVSASRLYRQTATQSGETTLVPVLEELERVLTEVAAGPETLGPAALAELQRRIESRGLLFKVRVVGSQVRARESAPVRSRESAS